MGLSKKVKKCRVCGSSDLYQFLDLGKMPLANNFLTKEDLSGKEERYPLFCLFCQRCALVQLGAVVNPDLMFRDYLYVPSGSRVMMNNFASLAYEASKRIKINERSLVLDIGSNDGTLLTLFKKMGAGVLGVDPAKNLAKVATMRGVPTEACFFNKRTAGFLCDKYGKADLVVGTNVAAHIDDLSDFFGGVSTILSSQGLFVCEFPYLLDLISGNQFDTIYHEHLSYFALGPWSRAAQMHGFEITDVRRLSVHGGSLRLTHMRQSGAKRSRAVNYLMSIERRQGLYKVETYEAFVKRVFALKDGLRSTLLGFKKRKKRIVGLGAAAKGNVLTNFLNIGREILDYIADSTPYKWGLYTPGKHIPIYPEEKVFANRPDYCVIFAWNFANEIMRKYRSVGTKFIVPIPEVKIV